MIKKILIPLLIQVINKASPEVRQLIKEQVIALEKKAEATKSPYDDIIVMIIKAILNY